MHLLRTIVLRIERKRCRLYSNHNNPPRPAPAGALLLVHSVKNLLDMCGGMVYNRITDCDNSICTSFTLTITGNPLGAAASRGFSFGKRGFSGAEKISDTGRTLDTLTLRKPPVMRGCRAVHLNSPLTKNAPDYRSFQQLHGAAELVDVLVGIDLIGDTFGGMTHKALDADLVGSCGLQA